MMNKNKIKRLLLTLIMCIAMIAGVCAIAGCKNDKTYYTVTFDSSGGSQVLEQVIESGATAKKPDPDPEKDGYVLEGWYTEDGKAFVFTTPITADMTLTAKWTEAEKITYYKVSFDVGDYGEAPATQTVKENGKAVNPGELTSSTHVFAGWYKDSECKHSFDFESEITEDTVIYAKWTKIDDTQPDDPKPPVTTDKYTVTFKDGDTVVKTEKVEKGKTVTAPQLEDKEDYTFNGWFTESGDELKATTTITSDVTYIASWTEKGTPKPPVTTVEYTVTFETNGGTTEVKKAIVNSGSTLTKPDDPVKAGYVLEGWYTDEQCTAKYNFETPVTKDITLYAKWDPATAASTYEVTIESNGGDKVL